MQNYSSHTQPIVQTAKETNNKTTGKEGSFTPIPTTT